MTFVQLIYASRPFGYDDLALGGILASARHHNARNAITGSLICREDVFLQILEGPRDAIEATYLRIARDGRHVEVDRLWSGEAQARLFPAWTMRHDPARSWMWTASEVAAGAIKRAPPPALLAIFQRLAAEPGEIAEGAN